jgi:Flp pilus assembly pilin Flp
MLNHVTHLGRLALARRQLGITTVEYAVAGGLIAAAVIIGFFTLGGTVGGVINDIANRL